MNGYVLETRDLTKSYNVRPAVDGVSVAIKRGEIYGLIGKNGAGKTTFMRLILGLCEKDRGEVMLFGDKDLNRARAKIGSLIEEPGLYRSCTAYENMKRFAMLYGADKAEIPEILDLVGLSDTGNKKAGEFSLGMRQRLGIAIALLNRPEMLLLDEPINGLDPAGIKEMRDLFVTLNKKGVTLIISSHILDELSKVVSVYGIINKGRIVEEIRQEELENRCKRGIVFRTSATDKAADAFKEKFPSGICETEEDKLIVHDPLDAADRINAELVSRGIGVYEISKFSYDIEDFFLEKMEK